MHNEIIEFWFEELTPAAWWKKDEAFDQMCRDRFSSLHDRAVKCELYTWRSEPLGRLAEIIVLDQFSRNMFRDTAAAFANDSMSLALAQQAVASGADQALKPDQRVFLYMPYMHSESLLIHEQAVVLYEQLGIENNLKFEIAHKRIIETYGRYPHRNKILGRESTPEELAFLDQPGSSF